MIDQNNKQLSSDGQARKDEMLTQLVGQMNHIHKARQVRRRVIHTLTLVVVCAGVVWAVSSKSWDSPQPNVFAKDPPSIIAPAHQTQKTTFIKTINDDELIALLAKIHRPAGVIRSEGRIWLSNPVTDEELDIFHETPEEDPSSL